ncbi:hypothetical protein [Sphingomonas sp. M1-B02]|uniref:hypothetical protein n=1 Tax=Sphingomonas sp. M1-B02 TaxID=3114300 RepID=UPI00223F71EE|nr:hypothetical protein [Sphingomonas sp. S6-11]UZK64800.1 hypothetical protein OKW87_09660 [Sphingomonas sp. S6-11]
MIRWLAPLILASAPAAAQLAPGEQTMLDLAFARGKLLYAYDQAAWHGTDDMLQKVKQPEKTVGGWIVDGPAEAPELIFYDQDKAEPHAVYSARFRGSRLASAKLFGPGDDRTLSPQRRALIAARDKATAAWLASGPKLCTRARVNSVVLPPTAPGAPTLVYMLTPQSALESFPFGGHYRIEVGPDSSAPTIRGFANSCLEMQRPTAAQRRGIMFVSHVLDPIPTEIHVFSALAARVQLVVGTSDKRLWSISDKGIKAEQPLKD